MSLTEVYETEPVWNGSGRYSIVGWANGEDVILYHEFGSYQGEWLLLTKSEKEYKIYKGYYGSCGGCDAFEAELSYSDTTLSQAKEFAKDYPSFIEVPIATMRNLVKKGTLKKIFPRNIKDTYSDLDPKEFAADAQIAVKLVEDIKVTAKDIIACKNQEIKQKALKQFGYEKFVKEAKPKTIHKDGENSLLQIDDIVFAYVKDGSTPRRYLLRVPPTMKTVREAIAWTFNMPVNEYDPLVET